MDTRNKDFFDFATDHEFGLFHPSGVNPDVDPASGRLFARAHREGFSNWYRQQDAHELLDKVLLHGLRVGVLRATQEIQALDLSLASENTRESSGITVADTHGSGNYAPLTRGALDFSVSAARALELLDFSDKRGPGYSILQQILTSGLSEDEQLYLRHLDPKAARVRVNQNVWQEGWEFSPNNPEGVRVPAGGVPPRVVGPSPDLESAEAAFRQKPIDLVAKWTRMVQQSSQIRRVDAEFKKEWRMHPEQNFITSWTLEVEPQLSLCFPSKVRVAPSQNPGMVNIRPASDYANGPDVRPIEKTDEFALDDLLSHMVQPEIIVDPDNWMTYICCISGFSSWWDNQTRVFL